MYLGNLFLTLQAEKGKYKPFYMETHGVSVEVELVLDSFENEGGVLLVNNEEIFYITNNLNL